MTLEHLDISDRQIVDQFFRSLKSKETARNYLKGLSYVFGFSAADYEASLDALSKALEYAKSSRAKSEYQLKEWILKKRESVAGATLRGYTSAVKSLFDFANIPYNWRQIQALAPRAARAAQDDATPIEATRELFRNSDVRLKFLISMFVSSGIRLGSFNWLRVRDLEEYRINGQTIGKLTVYRNEPEQYVTFVSSECWNLWNEYKEDRLRMNEMITVESPLVRNLIAFHQTKNPKHLKANSLRDLLSFEWRKAGYETRTWKQIHGWRKSFKTRLEAAGLKSLAVERLLGHLDQSYYKPTIQELAELYVQAQSVLFIDESLIAKSEVKQIQETAEKNINEQKVDLILANQKIASLQSELRDRDSKMKSWEERLRRLEESKS